MELEPIETMKVENVTVKTYTPPDYSHWVKFDEKVRMSICEEQEPEQVVTSRNTTTFEMHQWLVSRSDPHGMTGEDINMLALGSGSETPTEADQSLTNQVDTVEITSSNREGDSLRIKTFIGKGQGNVDVDAGESLTEIGLLAGDLFLNHAILPNDIDKTNTKTATVDVLITYDSA